jgi:hypothetical protein
VTQGGNSGSGSPGTAPGGTPPPAGPSLSNRGTAVVAVLGVLSAVLAVAAAYLGLQTAIISRDKEAAEAAASANKSTAEDLKRQVVDLEQENRDLQSQIGSPSAEPTAPANPTVRHAGQINIRYRGDDIDLDSPASATQWVSGDKDIDYSSHPEYFSPSSGSTYLRLGSTPASFETCTSSTGYQRDVIYMNEVEVGEYMCWRTSESRSAAVRILEFSDEGLLTLDVVTYDPPQR